jgi:hypothetical protein
MSNISTVHVLFTPDHVAQVPDDGSIVITVQAFRWNEEMADTAAALRNAGRDYSIPWVDNGGCNLEPEALVAAEKHMAKALAISRSKGRTKSVRVYAEEVRTYPLN